MFKNRVILSLSSVSLIIAIIGLTISFTLSMKVGGNIVLSGFVFELISGLTIYYAIGNNNFMGRTKKESSEAVLKKQSEGLKLLVPMILVLLITILFMIIIYLF